MEEILEKLNKEAGKISLKEEEKMVIKNILIAHIKKTSQNIPVRETVFPRQYRSESIITNLLIITNKKIMIATLIIALLLGGGTSFAAQGSLPGDILYPIKIKVNENVSDLLAFTPEADARHDERRIEERLREAERLAEEGKFTDANKQRIENGIDKASKDLNEHLAKLSEKKDLVAVSDVNSLLKMAYYEHSRSLEKFANKDNPSIDSIVKKINEHLDENDQEGEEIDNEIEKDNGPETQEAAAGKMKAAQEKINEVRKFIEEKKDKLTSEELAAINTQVAIAESSFDDGKTKFDAGNYGEAFVLFKQVSYEIQKAKLMVELGKEEDVENEEGDEEDDSLDQEIEDEDDSANDEDNSQGEEEQNEDENDDNDNESVSQDDDDGEQEQEQNQNGEKEDEEGSR